MPKTIYIGRDIKAAEPKVLFEERDFIELIGQYMGADAAHYMECLLRAAEENAGADGYDEGYDTGYVDGYTAGLEDGNKERSS